MHQSCFTKMLLGLSQRPGSDTASQDSSCPAIMELLVILETLVLLFSQIIVRTPVSVAPGMDGRSSNRCWSGRAPLNSL